MSIIKPPLVSATRHKVHRFPSKNGSDSNWHWKHPCRSPKLYKSVEPMRYGEMGEIQGYALPPFGDSEDGVGGKASKHSGWHIIMKLLIADRGWMVERQSNMYPHE